VRTVVYVDGFNLYAVAVNMKQLFPLLVLAGFSSSCSDADRSAEFGALSLFVTLEHLTRAVFPSAYHLRCLYSVCTLMA
jgi:hypothetical protein